MLGQQKNKDFPPKGVFPPSTWQYNAMDYPYYEVQYVRTYIYMYMYIYVYMYMYSYRSTRSERKCCQIIMNDIISMIR